MTEALRSRRDMDLADIHLELARMNRQRLAPGLPGPEWRDDLLAEGELRMLEGDAVEVERSRVAGWASQAPTDADAFLAWYERLDAVGPGQGDPLFPWLAETASLDQMRWFLRQEIAGEAGFDDLLALTQLRLPVRPKLELARNYWDELGRGHASAMHGPMLERLGAALSIEELQSIPVVWESAALGNLMIALASNRRYTYHAIGALGVIELTAPGRATRVHRGLKRLGVAPKARHYFALHATLDRQHSASWNREIIHPIVMAQPEAAHAIAEGALIRLEAGKRCGGAD
jgi:hypothetical protein